MNSDKHQMPKFMTFMLLIMGLIFFCVGMGIAFASFSGSMSWESGSGEPTGAFLPGLVFLVMFGGAGVLMFSMGVRGIINGIRREGDRRWLVENGVMVTTEVVGIDDVEDVVINGRHPMYLVGRYNGVEYKSELVSDDVARLCGSVWDTGGTLTVDMLVDNPHQIERHYIDISTLQIIQGSGG